MTIPAPLYTISCSKVCLSGFAGGGKREQEHSQEVGVEELCTVSASVQTSSATLEVLSTNFRLCNV